MLMDVTRLNRTSIHQGNKRIDLIIRLITGSRISGPRSFWPVLGKSSRCGNNQGTERNRDKRAQILRTPVHHLYSLASYDRSASYRR